MREGSVEANGLRFSYVEEGDGPLVLLLHGFPEFERNRAATIAAVEDASEDLLREQVRTAGAVEGTAAEALNYLAVVHLDGHLDDLRGTS